jgi:putative transposase
LVESSPLLALNQLAHGSGYLRHYPIEHLWQYLKADLRWASFKTLEELQLKLGQLLSELTPEIIAGITGYPFILDALSVINTI